MHITVMLTGITHTYSEARLLHGLPAKVRFQLIKHTADLLIVHACVVLKIEPKLLMLCAYAPAMPLQGGSKVGTGWGASA